MSQRSTSGWEKAVNAAIEADRDGAMREMVALWKGLGFLPGIADVITGSQTAAKLREQSLLSTAGVQYAIAYAIYLAHEGGTSYGDAAKALAAINFSRPRLDPKTPPPSEVDPVTPDESIFAGNLIDPATGKVGGGRPAWEAAGESLFSAITDQLKVALKSA